MQSSHSRGLLAGVFPTILLVLTGCHSHNTQTESPMNLVSAKPPIAAERPYQVPSPNGARNDSYYWLRDDERKNVEMLDYLKAENAYTDAMLAHTKPLQEKIYNEIVARIKQDDASVPYRKRGYWYYRRFENGKDYPIYARKKGSLDASEEILLDVNKMAEGHAFFQIGSYEVSPNNRLLAWAEDSVGRRQFTLRVRNLDTGETFTDSISDIDPSFAWAGDNKTIFYVAKDLVTLLGDKVRKHTLGTDVNHDALIYEEKDKSFYTNVNTTKDEAFVAIFSHSTVSTEMRVARSLDPTFEFRVLIPRERDHEYSAEHLDNRWIIRTNWQAKNFRIVEAADKTVTDRNTWRDVVAHRDNAFVDNFDLFNDFLAVEEHSNGLANIRIQMWKDGKSFLIDSDEPAYTTGLGANSEMDSHLVRYTYTSLTTPPSTYDFDVTNGHKTLLKREPVLGGFDQTQYTTEHLWATARDGIKVPISLVYRKGFKKDGSAPLLQYGYGSYGLTMDPSFSITTISLLDRGFVYAIAHIRGGQEMGRAWYENGKLLNKKNTFTDFIDVTRFLVAEKYADPKRVFASGGSAGGLLMGAVMNMAPQDYRGIVAQVPFVDVVTTMLDESIPLTTNEFDEWGNPKEKKFYEYMLSYSPYDNVSAQHYPAIFVGTGLWDSQVQYYEPAKWVAKLRKFKTDTNPLVFRINMEAGHGGKSGRFKRFNEIAEQYAFMLDRAGVNK